LFSSYFRSRPPSLLRGNLMVLGSLGASFLVARFPFNQPQPAIVIPLLVAILGMAETFRCLRLRWSLYHGAVMLSLYMDIMALAMIVFLAVFPLLARLR
jgi:hypothetical protein